MAEHAVGNRQGSNIARPRSAPYIVNGMNGSWEVVQNHAAEVSELTQELRVFQLNTEEKNAQGRLLWRLAVMIKNAQ